MCMRFMFSSPMLGLVVVVVAVAVATLPSPPIVDPKISVARFFPSSLLRADPSTPIRSRFSAPRPPGPRSLYFGHFVFFVEWLAPSPSWFETRRLTANWLWIVNRFSQRHTHFALLTPSSFAVQGPPKPQRFFAGSAARIRDDVLSRPTRWIQPAAASEGRAGLVGGGLIIR